MRLTNYQRKTISNRLIYRKFSPLEKELDKIEKALGDEVYNELYPYALRNSFKNVEPRFLNTACSFKVQFGDEVTEVRFSSLKVLDHDDECRVVLQFPYEHYFSARYRDLDFNRGRIRNEKAAAKRDLDGTLTQFKSWAQLVKSWPEILPLIEDIRPKVQRAQLPSIPLGKLNAAFDLPPEDKEQ